MRTSNRLKLVCDEDSTPKLPRPTSYIASHDVRVLKQGCTRTRLGCTAPLLPVVDGQAFKKQLPDTRPSTSSTRFAYQRPRKSAQLSTKCLATSNKRSTISPSDGKMSECDIVASGDTAGGTCQHPTLFTTVGSMENEDRGPCFPTPVPEGRVERVAKLDVQRVQNQQCQINHQEA